MRKLNATRQKIAANFFPQHEIKRPPPDHVGNAMPGYRTYIVKEGDTLSAIAGRELGDWRKWPKLYHLNEERLRCPQQEICLRVHGGDPSDWIFAGQELILPRCAGAE